MGLLGAGSAVTVPTQRLDDAHWLSSVEGSLTEVDPDPGRLLGAVA
jgi:hypothetical protein